MPSIDQQDRVTQSSISARGRSRRPSAVRAIPRGTDELGRPVPTRIETAHGRVTRGTARLSACMHGCMLESVTAAERVYQRVRASILTGEYGAGALLSEVEVAAALQVSRTPAHEAFRRLESEGLLQLIPRRGAVVVPVSPREAIDVLEVRHALETAAVRRLAGETAEAEIRRAEVGPELADLIEQQRKAAAAKDVPGFAAADEAFHRAIVTASGNALALRLYSTLADRQRLMTVGSVGGRHDHLLVLIAEHEQLAAAVTAGSTGRFADALLAHLYATHQALIGSAIL